MNTVKLVIVSIFLFASGNLFAGKVPKVLVCHVGEEGTIDLILVSGNSSHIGNAAHSFEGLEDYTPDSVGASGSGTEDFDGDGVDEGCEPPEVASCPCWELMDLTAVTAENQSLELSCNDPEVSNLPVSAGIQNEPGSTEVEGGFFAADFGGGNSSCQTRDFEPFVMAISPEEAASCIEQIVDRCEFIGTPITPAELP
jgi:hypothetical protein